MAKDEGMRQVLGLVGWSDAYPSEGTARIVDSSEQDVPEPRPISLRAPQ